MPVPIPKKLIALGDSGVYGWGDPHQGGWCERLRRHWMELPGGPVLYNLGVRGDGLERLARRLSAEVLCRGELRRQTPQGILIGIGLPIRDGAMSGSRSCRPRSPSMTHSSSACSITAERFRWRAERERSAAGASDRDLRHDCPQVDRPGRARRVIVDGVSHLRRAKLIALRQSCFCRAVPRRCTPVDS